METNVNKNRRKTTAPEAGSKRPSTEEACYDQIRCRAYEIFCERNGNGGGDHVSDWLQAERELTAASKTRGERLQQA